VLTTAEAAQAADMIMILAPDHVQADVYAKDIEPHLKPGKTLMFAHGFSIHFGTIKPPAGIDVSMVARRLPAIASARCSPKVRARRRWSPFTRTLPARRSKRAGLRAGPRHTARRRNRDNV